MNRQISTTSGPHQGHVRARSVLETASPSVFLLVTASFARSSLHCVNVYSVAAANHNLVQVTHICETLRRAGTVDEIMQRAGVCVCSVCVCVSVCLFCVCVRVCVVC